jgi:hypothetical protein
MNGPPGSLFEADEMARHTVNPINSSKKHSMRPRGAQLSERAYQHH